MKKILYKLKQNGWSVLRSFLLFYVFPALLLAACVLKARDIDPKKDAAPAVVVPAGTPVDAQIVTPNTLRDELEVTGTLVANQQVDIVSELTRRVVRVGVRDGAYVRKGELLFQLDDADLQAQFDRYKQEEKLAQLNETRLKDLIAHEAIAQQDYDEASTRLHVLRAQIRETEVMLSKTRIVAPFDGQIGMVRVHPGAVVSVNTLLTNIDDNSIIKVEFAVPEKYAPAIRVGSEQHFTITSDQKRYTATVAARGASLEEDTRTLLVRAVTPNKDGHLLPGQSARLTLSLNTSENALVVFSQALIPSSSGYIVYVERNHLAQPTPVQIGQRSAGSVEIISGLSKGDTVITSNLLRLMPGTPVANLTIK